jgi:hypothetical protein
MQPLESTVSDRDTWSGHWSLYAESAGENPAQQMRHKLLLNQIRSVGSEVALLLDIGSGQGDFWQWSLSHGACADASASNSVRSG